MTFKVEYYVHGRLHIKRLIESFASMIAKADMS